MSLTNCRACGKPVAHDAKACPHCGKQDPGFNPLSIVFGLIILGIIFLIGYCHYK